MESLIIGYGSIGKRHSRILSDMGLYVTCVTSNSECPFPAYKALNDALAIHKYDLVIISNKTCDHYNTLLELLKNNFRGKILIEKPLFSQKEKSLSVDSEKTFTAYNMRYHPVILRSKTLLENKKIFSAQFHVGQYLPEWRPETDYTKCYSAIKKQGGGVIRDLSHELDTAMFLLGDWTRATAMGGHFSNLEIDSDDVFTVLMETKSCKAVTVHMDYLNRTIRRGFDINAEGISIRADLVDNWLEINGNRENFTLVRDDMFKAQLTAIISNDNSIQCTYEQGLSVLELIDAAEKSAQQTIWIEK